MTDCVHRYLRLRSEGAVAYVTLANPPVNALGSALIAELSAAFERLAADRSVRAIVLAGEGGMFAAGADIKEFAEALGDEDAAMHFADAAHRLFDRVERLEKPVVCAIHGACLGGGLELAMSCHLRVAAEGAKLGQPELALGLIPGYGGTQRLAALTNRSIALELILTGRTIDGTEAERIGLVNRAVPADAVLPTAAAWAESIATERSALGVAATIRAVRSGAAEGRQAGLELEKALFAELFASEDAKEGIAAFLEKRKPTFRHR